jgi:putative ABC transport system substrate-binding protein
VRRAVIEVAALALVLVAAPLAAEAQQAGKVYRIGFLSFAPEPLGPHAALSAGLRELGYVEGRNIIVERRFAAGDAARLAEFAAELVRLKVDLIVASATPPAQAVQKATTTIPIIFVGVVDPVGAQLLSNLARPNANITGLSLFSTELSGKRLELLKEIVPKLSRVAIFSNPANASNPLQVRETEAAAQSLGVQPQLLEVRVPNDFDRAFEAAVRGRADAVVLLDDPLTFWERTRIAALAAKHRLPAVYGFPESVEAGGLIAFGTSLPDHYRRAATYVDRILKGARPADLPVEQPTKFRLVINIKTAKALGMTIPPSLLLRADQIVK